MYKVFISEKPVVLATEAGDELLQHGVLMARTCDVVVLRSVLDALMDRPKITGLVLLNDDLEALFEAFRSLFHPIEAAGGIVRNSNGQLLFIFRNGRWDLPKGKLEAGETIEEGAMREVEEECGIHGLGITGELRPTYHVYEMHGKVHFKTTYWFQMHYSGNEALVPQTEEGIERVEWIAEAGLDEVRKNTWSNILELIGQLG